MNEKRLDYLLKYLEVLTNQNDSFSVQKNIDWAAGEVKKELTICNKEELDIIKLKMDAMTGYQNDINSFVYELRRRTANI